MKTLRFLMIIAFVLFAKFVYAQTAELDKAKAVVAEMLKNEFEISVLVPCADKIGYVYEPLNILPLNVTVSDDRIELTYQNNSRTILYTDNLHRFKYKSDTVLSISRIAFQYTPPSKSRLKKYPDYESDYVKLKKNFIFLRNSYVERIHDLSKFKPIADKYRALTVKPPMSEEVRKYIVQANLSNQQKQYLRAISLYNNAIELDPTVYPAAYSNLALLSAQLTNFDDAIFYMKKYLMLVPEAEDARSSQDKIYEWELSAKIESEI